MGGDPVPRCRRTGEDYWGARADSSELNARSQRALQGGRRSTRTRALDLESDPLQSGCARSLADRRRRREACQTRSISKIRPFDFGDCGPPQPPMSTPRGERDVSDATARDIRFERLLTFG